MKQSIRFLTLLVLVSVLTGCAGGPRLAGTWVMIENNGRNLEVPETPRPGDSVKKLGPGQFAFGELQADGGVRHGGGGDWYLEDGKYVEVVRFHWHEALQGETIVFDCTVRDDLWIHRADFTANGRRFHIDEIWRRVHAGRSYEERRERH